MVNEDPKKSRQKPRLLTALSQGPGPLSTKKKPAKATPFDGAVERAWAAFDQKKRAPWGAPWVVWQERRRL
jgi:hypothetical protein